MQIKGLNRLSLEQKEIMYRTNEIHTKCVGNSYKDGMEIRELSINKQNILYVLLKNGWKFHYTKNLDWY